MKHEFTERQRKIFYAVSLAVFIIFVATVSWFIGRPMITFVDKPEQFRAWVNDFGLAGRIVFVGMVFLQVVIALIPGEPLELAAGYAFGTIEGTLLCSIGILLGSLAVFGLVRTFGTRFVGIFFPEDKLAKLKFLKYSRKRNILMFIIFFIPGTPKDLLCYFAGLTDIKLSMWVFISFFARIPSIITSTIAGDKIGEKNYLTSAIVFLITVIISIIGFFGYSYICKLYTKRRSKKSKI